MELSINGISSSFEAGLLFAKSPIILSVYSLDIQQGLDIGTPIGVFSTSLPGNVTYSLVSGEGSQDNLYFTIVDDQLVTSEELGKNDFYLRARVSGDDGYCYEQVLSINAIDTALLQGHTSSYLGDLVSSFKLNQSSILSSQAFGSLFISSPIELVTYEGISNYPNSGALIGQFVTTIQGTVSYSLVPGEGSEDNSAFIIVGDELIVSSSLTYKTFYRIRVRISGDDGYCYEQKFLLNVLDVVEQLGFFGGDQGEFSLKLKLAHQSILSQEVLNVQTFVSSFGLYSFDTGELFGSLSLDQFIGLTGFSGESLGTYTSSMLYSLGSIQTEESLEGSVAVDFFGISQTITWNIDQAISLSVPVRWDVGQGLQKWYRVQGCCLFPTAQGSGSGISGPFYPGGCDITNFESTDSKCIGAGGKQLFIQNILATSVSDVCRQLNEYNMKWQICSMQVYSNPAGPALDQCNRLIDVPFSSYPECLEISLHADVVVKIKFLDSVTISLKYSGSGGVGAEGEVVPTGATSLSSYSYTGSGVLYTGGSGEISSSWKELLEVEASLDFYIDYIEAVSSIRPDNPALSGATGLVRTTCGACTSIPSILYSYGNLDKSYVLSRFISKNGISFPTYFPMYYNSLLKSWTANYQVSGYGDSGGEKWNFIFSWSCLNQRAEEYASPYWKYSIFVNRAGQSIDYDTRISITFPPQELCRLIDNLSIDFSFSLNVSTLYIDNAFIDVTDYVVFSDRIGLFKDASWSSDPWLDMRISRLASTSKFQTIDLSPIIP